MNMATFALSLGSVFRQARARVRNVSSRVNVIEVNVREFCLESTSIICEFSSVHYSRHFVTFERTLSESHVTEPRTLKPSRMEEREIPFFFNPRRNSVCWMREKEMAENFCENGV